MSGTGIDAVPKLPKCPVPVLMSYRSYRSVRYRYYVVPSIPKFLVPVVPPVYTGGRSRYVPCLLLLGCTLVYIYMIRCHKRRALGALLCLVSRSEPASTDSYSFKMWLRRNASTEFAHRVRSPSPTRRDRCSCICVNLVLLLYQALLSYIFT